MSQFILLASVTSPDYTYAVLCSGRKLTLDEVKLRQLVTDDQLGSFKQNMAEPVWSLVWFEVQPGDKITFTGGRWTHRLDYYNNLLQDKWIDETLTVVVPISGFVNPPELESKVFQHCLISSLIEYYKGQSGQQH